MATGHRAQPRLLCRVVVVCMGRAALRAANGRPGAGEVQWAEEVRVASGYQRLLSWLEIRKGRSEEVRVWLAATNSFSLGSGLGTHCNRKRRLNAAVLRARLLSCSSLVNPP